MSNEPWCTCLGPSYNATCPAHGHIKKPEPLRACKCALDPKTGLVVAFSALCPVGGHAQQVTGQPRTVERVEQRSVFEPYETFYTTVDYDPTKTRCWQVLPDGSVKEIADDDARIRRPLPDSMPGKQLRLLQEELMAKKPVLMMDMEAKPAQRPRRGVPGRVFKDENGENYVVTEEGLTLRLSDQHQGPRAIK